MDGALLSQVHHFWFGELAGPADFPEAKAPMWFRQDAKTDAMIAGEFGGYLQAASELDPAGLDRKAAIGLVILLDQFPRNIYRDSANAFAYDAAARSKANAILLTGLDRFYLVERSFLFLPFEHSEDLADQARSVALFKGLLAAAPEGQKAEYSRTLEFAVRHHDLIATFGRFPHRNGVLGRPSTPQEETFLAEHGRGY